MVPYATATGTYPTTLSALLSTDGMCRGRFGVTGYICWNRNSSDFGRDVTLSLLTWTEAQAAVGFLEDVLSAIE